jgi:hypothetical protein
MSKLNPRTNKYRSGAKNPERQVLVSDLPEGGYAVTVFDTKNWKLVHKVIGSEEKPESEKEA